ncbi:ATP-binding protein [uncultured Prevotella sp.]|uniref:ATP-binding protein n=1 Tax=uncultured Prevotella sp. TaxID=159272 RepID=UPI0027E384DF|nr:ATP-binding protein [uncultured Prevotella sp.]
MKQNLIERQGYSDRIERMFGKGMVVALTGQRRVGKSCVMKRIYEKYSQDSHNNVIYIDMEKTAFADITNYENLEAYVAERLDSSKDNYLFIDEVQEIQEFEKAILSLQSDGSCQIMVTGSNAKMLSSELSTRLRGRYIGYHIHGLDYEEFIEFHNLQDNDESLGMFLQYGGLPQLRQFGLANSDLIDDYFENVVNTIVLRDIIERESIRNVPLLRTLVRFIADNIGKQFSARSIVGVLKSQNTETSTNMVLNYLEYLCNAYIIDRVGRYNIHGKKILELGDSFYFEDLGLRNHLVGGNRRFDIEKVMENAVYRHLLRLGYTVYIGILHKAEIDFVAEKQGSTVYIQVCYMLASEDTVEREFGNLRMIKDSHPKYVVSMDRMYGKANVDGIRHLHLRDFLKLRSL